MPESSAQKPCYNPRYIAAGRRSWTTFSPKNVVILDPKVEYMHSHASEKLTLSDGRTLSVEQAYRAARESFDVTAAQAFVMHMLEQVPEKLQELKEKFGNKPPEILWESADPMLDNPRNALPVAYAQALAEALGWKCTVRDYIRKINPSCRKGTTGLERLIKQPFYNGKITPGTDYLIIDDHLNGGTTVANINSFIEQNGGHAVGITVLNGYGSQLEKTGALQGSVQLAPTKLKFLKVQMHHLGEENFSDLHKAFFNAPAKKFEECCFTEGELKLIENFCVQYLKHHLDKSLMDKGQPPSRDEVFHALVDKLVPLALQREQGLFIALSGHAPGFRMKSEIDMLKDKLDEKAQAEVQASWTNDVQRKHVGLQTPPRARPLVDHANRPEGGQQAGV